MSAKRKRKRTCAPCRHELALVALWERFERDRAMMDAEIQRLEAAAANLRELRYQLESRAWSALRSECNAQRVLERERNHHGSR
jgi:hypothetical protein